MEESVRPGTPLRLLSLEDSPLDFELITEQLLAAGYDLKATRVETLSKFEEVLCNDNFDVILADYRLSGFDAFSALEIYKKVSPETPFICMSGSIGEETAIALIRQGVTDYLLKDRPKRLPSAIQRAMEASAEQRKIKEAERKLRESEARFRQFIETAFEGVTSELFDMGINFVNNRMAEMLRYSPQEIMGKPFSYFIFEEDLPDHNEKMLRRKQGLADSYERKLRRKDGSILWTLVSASPVTDAAGLCIGAFGLYTDITERKKAEYLLREREERFRAVTQTANDGIVTADARGIIYSWNLGAEKIFGYTEQDIIGLPITIIIAPEFRQLLSDGMDRIIHGGEYTLIGKTVEMAGLRKDGSGFPVELSLARWDSGGQTFFTGIIRDITARKQAEADLIAAKDKAEESNRVKSNFLANMSHELRTPLIGILGFSELLVNSLNNPGQREMAVTIHESGERLKKTLNMILDLSKVEAKQLNITIEEFNIIPVIEKCCALYTGAARKKNLEFTLRNSLPAIYAYADRRLLTDALNNLLSNAIIYTEAGSVHVTLSLQQANGISHACIRVSDTGIGISTKDFQLIFEEFRQVSEGRSRGFEGTGLGLTLTKKYVDLMKGSISVESIPDQGSTFTIYLPAARQQLKTEAPAREVPESFSELSKPVQQSLPVLLYVEDDEISRRVVRQMLSDICEMEFAQNGEEALDLVHRKQFDCILMDMNLGRGIDGVGVTKQIRQIPNYYQTPVIAVTAYAMVGDKDEFIAAGCSDYISKPFRQKEIAAIIMKALNM